uniref:Splicing factor 3a subunit 2 n=1 Tax=Serinus canaria TaxID=9135 RepID=A0A8C9U2V9_SERCA
MDFQHRPGGKTGSGGVASASESNRDRRERLRQLALETIDINKVQGPPQPGGHGAGSQARRAAKEAKEAPAQPAPEKVKVEVKKFVKIGRPGYKVTKQRDPETGQQSLLFQIDYPEIAESIMPRHRFMSAYEQRIEPPDRRWQYLLMAAEPYETIAFKVPSREIDKAEGKFWTHWNRETKQFFLQFHFKMEKPPAPPQPPPLGPRLSKAAAPLPDERVRPRDPPADSMPPSPGACPAPMPPRGRCHPPQCHPSCPQRPGVPPPSHPRPAPRSCRPPLPRAKPTPRPQRPGAAPSSWQP